MRLGPRTTAVLAGLLAVVLAAPAAPEAPEALRRIVSLAPSVTEMLFAVGAGDQVVGVTRFCDYPPPARRLPKVGGITPLNIDLERIVRLRPELVLSSGDGQEPVLAGLARLGIPGRVLPAASLAEVLDRLEEVGRLTGHADRARRLRSELERRVERVRRSVARRSSASRPRVFFLLWDRPLTTTGRSFVSELIELAGGDNVFGDLSLAFPEVSEEAVIARDPQVILVPDHDRLDFEALRRRPGWELISAVRRGRIHRIPGDAISRPGPRLVDALEVLAGLLAPAARVSSPPALDGRSGTAPLPRARSTSPEDGR